MAVSLERRSAWWSAGLVLVGAAGVGVAALAYVTSPLRPDPPPPASSDTKIQVPMFVEPSLVRPTPRFRFTFDPPEALADLRAEERLDEVVARAGDDMARARALMHWTRRQWKPGVPSPYPPLNARIILRDIRRGFTGGFCAQYNYVLVQALQSFGIPARYASVREHEVIEARLRDQGRWICFDPLYDTIYTDGSDRPLSVLEIHRRVRAGEMVRPGDARLIENPNAHLDLFRSFAIWLKNDHVTSPLNFTDIERYKVHFLEDPAGAIGLPPGALWTSEPADLYPG